LVRAVLAQDVPGVRTEVVVVDDGSTDETGPCALSAGAQTITLPTQATGGNPAAARNRGVRESDGDPIVFLDADCTPSDGWLAALLRAHAEGVACVGGALALPPGLSWWARCDYYSGWYHVHPHRPPGPVPNHPPANLSVRRGPFLAAGGFCEDPPISYAHEELRWQAELRRAGLEIRFQPGAVAFHRNRPGLGNLLRRNYRWGYSAVESKVASPAARMAWIYRWPRILIASGLPLAPVQTLYVVVTWLRAGVFEPLLMFPGVLAARIAYGLGMTVGGLRWLVRRETRRPPSEPRWR
jgi:glycosyltransferase involved in cell wall biosynthesis